MIVIPKNVKRGRQKYFARIGQEFKATHSDDAADILIYDEISPWGITALDVRKELDKIDAPEVSVHINSPGGDIFDGITIHNDLRSHSAKVNVKITGLAASAASIIAMAGDTIEMADNAFMMIHNAWALAVGDRNDFADMSETLRRIDASLAHTYSTRTGTDQDEIADMMDAETWLSADDAINKGFADSKIGEEEVSALFDLSVYADVPALLKRDIEEGLRDAGYSRNRSAAAMATGFHNLGRREAGDRDQRDAEIGEMAAYVKTLTNLYKGRKV